MIHVLVEVERNIKNAAVKTHSYKLLLKSYYSILRVIAFLSFEKTILQKRVKDNLSPL